MAYTYAGQFGPEAVIATLSGATVVVPNATVTVYETDGTTKSTLYTDRTKTTTAANPTATDATGNLTFYANPGQHVVTIVGVGVTKTITLTVETDPAEAVAIGHQPINVLDAPYNVDNTGASNAQPGLAQAVLDSITSKRGVYVPPGVYSLSTTLDLSTLAITADIAWWSFIVDPAARFTCPVGFAGAELINFAPPENHQILGCTIQIGVIQPTVLPTNVVDGIRFRNINDCLITIGRVTNVSGSGILVDCTGTPNFGVFNNIWKIGASAAVGQTGFVTTGSASVNGFQGNTVDIGHVMACGANGVVLDSNGVGLNSEFNLMRIGVSEHNTGNGIIDGNGQNVWLVGNTNNNTLHGFGLTTSAVGKPKVRGFIADTVNLNNGIADLVNSYISPGSVTPPAVPASTVAQRNTFERPARVYVNGGTVSVIAIGGVATGATSGVFDLLPGQTLTLTYTVAPIWTWFLR